MDANAHNFIRVKFCMVDVDNIIDDYLYIQLNLMSIFDRFIKLTR